MRVLVVPLLLAVLVAFAEAFVPRPPLVNKAHHQLPSRSSAEAHQRQVSGDDVRQS